MDSRENFFRAREVLTCQQRGAFGSDDRTEEIDGKPYCTHISCILYSRRVTSSDASSSSQSVWLRLACRSGRDAGLASSTMVLVRVLLHRGETTWQQRRGADVKKPARGRKAPAESRAARAARGKPAAVRAGAKRAHVRAVKRQALLYERKSRRFAGFFASTIVSTARWRAPLSVQ